MLTVPTRKLFWCEKWKHKQYPRVFPLHYVLCVPMLFTLDNIEHWLAGYLVKLEQTPEIAGLPDYDWLSHLYTFDQPGKLCVQSLRCVLKCFTNRCVIV